MGAAAGAHVHPRDGHDAHGALQGFFAAVVQFRQLLRRRPGGFHRQVHPDGLVGHLLHHLQIPLLQRTVEIDEGTVLSHVEAHIVIAVAPVDHAAEDMVGGMLLGIVKAARAVHMALHLRSRQQRLGQAVEDHALRFLDIQHVSPLQDAQVAGLAAALGIERRTVEHDVPAVLRLPAFQHPRAEGELLSVFIVEFLRFHAIHLALGNTPPKRVGPAECLKTICRILSKYYASQSFSRATDSISLMRFSWLTRVAPGS